MRASVHNLQVCTSGVQRLQVWLQVQQLMARRGRRRTPTRMPEQMKVGCPLAEQPMGPCQMLACTHLHS